MNRKRIVLETFLAKDQHMPILKNSYSYLLTPTIKQLLFCANSLTDWSCTLRNTDWILFLQYQPQPTFQKKKKRKMQSNLVQRKGNK